MPDNSGDVRRIVWQDAFPWFPLLLRCFPIAVEFRKLIVSAIALLLTGFGWSVIQWFFQPENLQGDKENWPHQMIQSHLQKDSSLEPYISQPEFGWDQFPNPMRQIWQELILPFAQLFTPEVDGTHFSFHLLSGLWALLVWCFFGGMLTRMSALQLAREERSSLREALGHAAWNFKAYFSAPVFPLLGALFLFLPMILSGLIASSDVGMIVMGVLWPLQIIAAILMSLLLIGALLGWPLMWATVASEESDSFDALTRSYGYLYQRPFHFLFYLTIASIIGMASWWLVMMFTSLIIYFSMWTASWGTGLQRIEAVIQVMPADLHRFLNYHAPEQPSLSLQGNGELGANMIAWWVSFLFLLGISYGYSYFWTASTAIYLLLRRELDGTEFDDIQVEFDEELDALAQFSIDNSGLPVLKHPVINPDTIADDSSTSNNGSKEKESSEGKESTVESSSDENKSE